MRVFIVLFFLFSSVSYSQEEASSAGFMYVDELYSQIEQITAGQKVEPLYKLIFNSSGDRVGLLKALSEITIKHKELFDETNMWGLTSAVGFYTVMRISDETGVSFQTVYTDYIEKLRLLVKALKDREISLDQTKFIRVTADIMRGLLATHGLKYKSFN